MLSGALSIGACLLTVLLIDRIGRKPVIYVAGTVMAAAALLHHALDGQVVRFRGAGGPYDGARIGADQRALTPSGAGAEPMYQVGVPSCR